MSKKDDPNLKALRLHGSIPYLAKELHLSDSIASALAEHSRLAQAMEPSLALAKAFAEQETIAKQYAFAMRESTALSSVLKSLRGQALIPSFAIGPLADLKALGLFDARKDLLRDLGIDRSIFQNFDARFHLPDTLEAARLAAEFDTSFVAKAFESLAGSISVRQAMESMKSPWLDIANPLTSASAFAAIQEVGNAIGVVPTFDAGLSSALRLELGDWREQINWPEAIFTDFEARGHFYASLGVNAALTTMPVAAFRESLGIAGLVDAPPPLVEEYEATRSEYIRDGEEEWFARTNEAHNRLQRLETQLRRFIDAVMTEEAGSNWPKHRMPSDTVDAWCKKKKGALRNSDADFPLIAYADFTDYERIICKRDNWKLFEKYFDRMESVRESLQRLYPIRVDTMHSRPITQDDELFLLVECKRLMRAMERRSR